jgi:hypothetical protein
VVPQKEQRDPQTAVSYPNACSVNDSGIGGIATTVDDLSAKPPDPEQQGIEEYLR